MCTFVFECMCDYMRYECPISPSSSRPPQKPPTPKFRFRITPRRQSNISYIFSTMCTQNSLRHTHIALGHVCPDQTSKLTSFGLKDITTVRICVCVCAFVIMVGGWFVGGGEDPHKYIRSRHGFACATRDSAQWIG